MISNNHNNILVKGPPAANVEGKSNNVPVLFAISWQAAYTRAFQRPRQVEEGAGRRRVTRDATSPAGSWQLRF